MLDDENIDVQELQEKLDLVEAKLEELAEESGGSEEPDFGFVQITSSSNSFFLHWITIEDTEFEKCEDVDSVQKALQAFKEADEKRSDQQRSFLHGDMLVLMCNSAKEEDEETEEVTYPDSCYFIGTCIVTGDGDIHEDDPDPDIKLSEKFGGKHFVAWNTCGGESCPEEPDTIQLDELIPPESAGDETDIKGIEITTDFSSPLKTKVHELKTLSFTKKEDSEDSEEVENPDEYVMFKDGDPFNAGALFEFSNIINEAADGFDVSADVTQVSLSSSSARIKEVTYKAKTYNLQPTEISSDSCGVLKKEDAKDEEDEPLPKVPVEILTKSDISGSSYDISSLSVVEGSESVSLGTLDLTSLMVTDDNFESGHFFVPKIDEVGSTLEQVCRDIATKSDIEILKDFKIDITQVSSGDNCTTITITPSTKKETFIFHSGLLTSKTNDDSWVAGTATSFAVGGCSADACRDAELGDLFFSTITRYSGSSSSWSLYRSYNYSSPILLNGTAVYNSLTIRDNQGTVIFTGNRGDSGFVNSSVYNGKNVNDDCEIHISTDLHGSDIPRSSLNNGELIKTGEKIVFT